MPGVLKNVGCWSVDIIDQLANMHTDTLSDLAPLPCGEVSRNTTGNIPFMDIRIGFYIKSVKFQI